MRELRDLSNKPEITIGFTDFTRLEGLASSVEKRLPQVAENLLLELGRARLVDDNALSSRIVRMESVVKFKMEKNSENTVQLVYPANADISEGRISVLTPIGTALIGLSVGQSIHWCANDGEERRLTILAVNGFSSKDGDKVFQNTGTGQA